MNMSNLCIFRFIEGGKVWQHGEENKNKTIQGQNKKEKWSIRQATATTDRQAQQSLSNERGNAEL